MAATEARSRVRVKHFWTFDGSAQPWVIDLLAGNDWYEEPPGAGVREPRRPRPFGPAGVMMLELPGTD